MIMYFSAAWMYCGKMLRFGTAPSPATWLPWAVMAIINALSFQVMRGDAISTIGVWSAVLLNDGVFLFALVKGKFSKMQPLDYILLAIVLISIVTWKAAGSASYANLVLQVGIFISIVPTWIKAWHKPSSEPAIPWLIWGMSYVPALIVMIIDWKGWPSLVLPINAMTIQLIVAGIVLARSKVR